MRRPPPTPQRFLDAGGKVPVCSRNDFIGRRHLLQRCLRHLRAWPGEAHYAEGILLYGIGGLGKSSTAARLVDRLQKTHEPVVCYGGLDETTLISALSKALAANASSILNDASMSLAQRLTVLFDHESENSNDKHLLIVFDDFEQNIPLSQREKARPHYNPDSLTTLNAVLQAIRDSQSDTRVIVTSRFDVAVTAPCQLSKLSLETLHTVDLTKKLDQLAGLQLSQSLSDDDKALRLKARELGAGNPRLLEWLNEVMLNRVEGAADLLDQLEQKEAEFREDLLIQALVDSLHSEVRHTLACAALYEIPVPLAAVEAVADSADKTPQQLHTTAKIGLIEVTDKAGEAQYFVSGLLDKALTGEIPASEQKERCGRGAQYLHDNTESPTEGVLLEIIRLAIAAKNQALAVEVGDRLTVGLTHCRTV